MNIYVCVKQVPDTETKIKLGGSGLDMTGVKWILNPYDAFAIEEALKFKAANPGAVVTAITLGPKERAKDALTTCVAMGGDEGILIDAPETTDNYTTALALAKVIGQSGEYKMILSGKLAIDDSAGAVSQMVAEFLNVPHATVISKAEYGPDAVTVEREVEGGAREIYELKFPCVISANKGLNSPRYPNPMGIMKAKKKVFKEVSLSSLDIAPTDTKLTYSQYELPADRPALKMISGDAATQARELVKLLREEAKVI